MAFPLRAQVGTAKAQPIASFGAGHPTVVHVSTPSHRAEVDAGVTVLTVLAHTKGRHYL